MAPAHLDHASTTPVRPAARAAMAEASATAWADPSRLHGRAMAARVALEAARDRVAAALGARPREVVFTSGATESINAVTFGVAERGTRQVATAVEHSAVPASAARFSEVRIAGVDANGVVDVDAIDQLADDHTAAVHVQWVNHEVGTVQPWEEVAARLRARRILLHVDAAQAIGRFAFDFGASGADLVSISGHKFGGPPGTGVLLVRRGVRIAPLLVGGAQERLRRAGLESVVGATGLAAALEAVDVDAEAAHQASLRDRLAEGLASLDGVERIGPTGPLAAPHLLAVAIADVEPQAVLLGLDAAGVEAHSGSACAAEDLEPSTVLAAMGLDAHRSLRFSVGWDSTVDDVDRAVAALGPVLERLRALRPSAPSAGTPDHGGAGR